jgi:hypothetical protein
MSVARRKSLLPKARRVACLVLGTVVLVPATATAKQPAPPTVRFDTATATGSGGDYTNVDIDARSGPSGESPTGTGSFTVLGAINIGGPVTCLNVTGNTAVLNINDQTFGFGIVTVSITDNGGGGSDIISTGPSGRAPDDCSPFTGLTSTLTNGRAAVFDAPPLPTSKEQCKNDGFAQFGFANQGQCIRFVTHN